MIKAIAFDLDDTLLDTTGLLVPMASLAAYQAMVAKGLSIDFKTFEAERKKGALSMKHQIIFQFIAEKYGHSVSNLKMGDAGSEAFYNPPIPAHLDLLAGAQENLIRLKDKYKIFVVTSGAVQTQKRKIQATGVEKLLQKVYVLDGFKKERKRIAFEDILKSLNLKPEELISIGNRLSQEIHDAKELGCLTCYFKYGEHVGEVTRNKFEIPDFTVEKHQELIATCRL